MSELHVYDTTLRDGAQQEGLNLSVGDKLAIAASLDSLGVGFIEGGWPGANPKDTEFFRRASTELDLQHARLAAFGATRRPGTMAADDPQVRALLDARTPVVTLVAKSHSRHVELALRTTPEENLAMVADTVSFLRRRGPPGLPRRRALLRRVPRRRRRTRWRCCARPPRRAPRSWHCATPTAACCPTRSPTSCNAVLAASGVSSNGSSGVRLGIHCHNDTGCAVANSLAAVDAGAAHVQGTLNGYGERTGNADLLTVVANLELKRGTKVLPDGMLREGTRVAHLVSEITNVPAYSRQPYVGASAFAHKAGLHASAIKVDPNLYQHIDPVGVGNDMRLLVSEMAGRASIELKGRELGFDLTDQPEVVGRVVARVKAMEAAGYTFEAADASFELLLHEEVSGKRPAFFVAESWRVITDSRPGSTALSEATVKLVAGGVRKVATGEGNGPVNALDHALRQALLPAYPELEHLELIDYRVRILDAAHGTDAVTRVLIETADPGTSWETVGVAGNILEASWEALVDGLTYGLLRAGVAPR